MELGNMIFGNSRGEFPVPRIPVFEEPLQKLFTQILGTKDEDKNDGRGCEFVSNTFEVHRFWWGNCTCGWDLIDNGQVKLNKLKHKKNCYQTDYEKLEKKRDKENLSFEQQQELLKPIYQKFGWETRSDKWYYGCALKCSCDLPSRENLIMQEYTKEFGHEGHKEDCCLVRPNFWYRPTNYQLMWYKYPLRDSYANQNLTPEQFQLIIEECIKSLKV